MGKAWWVGLLIVCAVGAGLIVHHRKNGVSKTAFDQVVTQMLVQQRMGKAGRENAFGPLCVGVSGADWMTHDAQSEVGLLGTVLSVPVTGAKHKADAGMLRKLDALAGVGLLTRSTDPSTPSMLHYTLSVKGWQATDYRPGHLCFVYAHRVNLGVSGFVRAQEEGAPGQRIYRVTARIGVSSEQALPAWARNAKIQAAFPAIRQNLAGKSQDFLVERMQGAWRPYLPIAKGTAKVRMSPVHGAPPSEDEIRRLIFAHIKGEQRPYCVALPSGRQAALPVHRDLSVDSSGHYEVAVFETAQRAARDPVLQRSLPYLNALLQAGVLIRHQSSLPGLRSGVAQENATVFEYSPEFDGRALPGRAACLSPGQPNIQIVDMQIIQQPAGSRGLPDGFRYKVRLLFEHPPAWMADVGLQQSWPELDHVLQDGWVCQGEFAFDRESRQPAGGTERCGWAFASVTQQD